MFLLSFLLSSSFESCPWHHVAELWPLGHAVPALHVDHGGTRIYVHTEEGLRSLPWDLLITRNVQKSLIPSNDTFITVTMEEWFFFSVSVCDITACLLNNYLAFILSSKPTVYSMPLFALAARNLGINFYPANCTGLLPSICLIIKTENCFMSFFFPVFPSTILT